jgi:biotin/methionine sulfoxide reductase
VRSVNSYSAGASAVILPHILGSFEGISRHNVTWDQVAEHTDSVLAFGGMALKNSDVASGGISRHIERDAMQKAARRGAVFYGIAPLRDDMAEEAGARWLPIRVGTDVALMLALAHTLLVENLWDSAFVTRYCTGSKSSNAICAARRQHTKGPAWRPASPAFRLLPSSTSPRRPPRGRTLITVSALIAAGAIWRQPWMGAVLRAMLGQIGPASAADNYAPGALGHTGRPAQRGADSDLSQGKNGVSDHIPVARIADMPLNSRQV